MLFYCLSQLLKSNVLPVPEVSKLTERQAILVQKELGQPRFVDAHHGRNSNAKAAILPLLGTNESRE